MWIQPKIARNHCSTSISSNKLKRYETFSFHFISFHGSRCSLNRWYFNLWQIMLSWCQYEHVPPLLSRESKRSGGLDLSPIWISCSLSDGLELWSSGTDPSDHVIVKAFQIWATSMAGLQSRLTDQQLCHNVHYVVLLSFAESFMYVNWNDSWQELITEHAVAGVEISSSTSQILVTD